MKTEVREQRVIMSSSSLLEIEAAYKDTKRILSIMKIAKRDSASFEKIQCGILHREIIIPIRFRSMVTKLFKKQSVQVKLVGEEFNN